MKHLYKKEGWGIFFNTDLNVLEAQKIDELPILKTDDEARELAKKKGFVFNDKNNPYHVTNFPTETIPFRNKPKS